MSFDNGPATGEGWFISECYGSVNGPWKLQKDDESGMFDDDSDAFVFVFRAASGGSAYHQGALKFLKENNPTEYGLIVQHYLRTCLGLHSKI